MLFLPLPLMAAEHDHFAPDAAKAVTQERLAEEMSARVERVIEFEAIRAMATKLGVRAWLFGGTAAAFAHYVRWDLLRESGDPRYQPDRFDYDYTNIFRSNQDLDIVVDGTPEQARQLQRKLSERFPYFQGSRPLWEVRLLRQASDGKMALLGNPNFLNQHSDSNSTGLIELTRPPAGEPVIRDLRDWENLKDPFFLRDVHQATLHYYFSERHEETDRFRQGLNPPIISVIRYLTKAFQYELRVLPEDLKKIRKVVKAFDPEKGAEKSSGYVLNWIEKNGKKLLQNAVNIEYASNVLDEIGLRDKLIEFSKPRHSQGSLSWWLQKEPLRSNPVGTGHGLTAAQMGIEVVAHETSDFMAYESITRAHTGDANVFISRAKALGENAAFGDGFYVRKGTVGARGTGITIRFHLDPDARLGTDFSVHGDYVVVLNKRALRVIPESLNLSPFEYFEMLAKGLEFDFNDRAVVEKLQRRVRNRTRNISTEELEKIFLFVQGERAHIRKQPAMFLELFGLPQSAKFPKMLADYMAVFHNVESDTTLARDVLSLEHWAEHPEILEALIQRRNALPTILTHVLTKEYWARHPWLLDVYLKETVRDPFNPTEFRNILTTLFSKSRWQECVQCVRDLLKNDLYAPHVIEIVLSHPKWASSPEVVKELIERGGFDALVIRHVLSSVDDNGRPRWIEQPELVRKIIQRGMATDSLVHEILSKSHWGRYPELLMEFAMAGHGQVDNVFDLLRGPVWSMRFELADVLERMIREGNLDYWVLDATGAHQNIWMEYPHLLDLLVSRGRVNRKVALRVLSDPSWRHHLWLARRMVERMIAWGDADIELVSSVLTHKHWGEFPDLIERIVRNGRTDEVLDKLLQTEHWSTHPELRRLCGGSRPTVRLLRRAFENGQTLMASPTEHCAQLLRPD